MAESYTSIAFCMHCRPMILREKKTIKCHSLFLLIDISYSKPSVSRGGGNSHMDGMGMFVGNFEFNP